MTDTRSDITPADRLRRAAELLRERATAARDVSGSSDWRVGGLCERGMYQVLSNDVWVLSGAAEEEATFIATMHPGVALAVADWLAYTAKIIVAEDEAEAAEENACDCPYCAGIPHALTVADTILGSADAT